jgi:glycosyltransferase involved in cell wall biosynthesis
MNILLLTQQLASYRSGVGTYALNLLKELMQRGHRITAVLPKGQVHFVNGVDFIEVRRNRFDITPGNWMSLGISFAKMVKKIHRKYDIVHFTDAREAWCLGRLQTPITGMVNDSYALKWMEPDYPRKSYPDRFFRGSYYFLLRKIENSTYPRFNTLIANSRYVAQEITTGYGLSPDRVVVVYHGLSHQAMPARISLPGSPALLFIGGNFSRKGLPLLIEATALLTSRFPRIHLHVVGKDRNQPTLAELAARRQLSDKVTFHGWKPNDVVRGMLAGADIFALPSLTEGFGLVYLEAMQIGTPVVATLIGGAKEVFREGQEAVFVDPRRVDEMALAVERIATDKPMAAALRENGRQAAARFTPLQMAEQTEAVWASLRLR